MTLEARVGEGNGLCGPGPRTEHPEAPSQWRSRPWCPSVGREMRGPGAARCPPTRGRPTSSLGLGQNSAVPNLQSA